MIKKRETGKGMRRKTTSQYQKGPAVVIDVKKMRNHLTVMKKYLQQLDSVRDDAELANVELQNMLQKQQQVMQILSNILKTLRDTMTEVARNIR